MVSEMEPDPEVLFNTLEWALNEASVAYILILFLTVQSEINT